jgi:hypothetical protein
MTGNDWLHFYLPTNKFDAKTIASLKIERICDGEGDIYPKRPF